MKSVIKRGSSQPASYQKNVSNSNHAYHPQPIHQVSTTSRITGLSKSAIAWGLIICSIVFNYKIFNRLEQMENSVALLQRSNAQQQVVYQQSHQPTTYAYAQASASTSRAPASVSQPVVFDRGPSAFEKLNRLDPNQYNVANYQAYSNYRYLLTDLSKNRRRYDARVSEIVDEYVKTHHITTSDRAEYNRVLDRADDARNAIRDLHDQVTKNWKQNSGLFAKH